MSQFKTFTELERGALRLHGLDTKQPSQLSDAFVLGMRYAKRPAEQPSEVGAYRTVLDHAKALYSLNPTYRDTRPLGWYEAPQVVRREWLDKAKAAAGVRGSQGGQT